MTVYADTGFLVSLYGGDSNSEAATAAVQGQPFFLLTPLGETEFVNAIELRVFRKDWTRREARAVHEKFLEHVAGGVFQQQALNDDLWKEAIHLSRRHTAAVGIRTLDLLHVASAKLFRPDAFCSFDQRQRKLAKALRLRVIPA